MPSHGQPQETRMTETTRAAVPDYPFAEFLEHFEDAQRFSAEARVNGETVDQTSMMLRMLESMRTRYSRAGAVSDLEAEATSTTEVELSWSNIAGNDTYRLERQTAPSDATVVLGLETIDRLAAGER